MDNSQEIEQDLRSLFGIVRRQFRLIFLTIVIVTSLAVTYVVTATPLYRAEALILVDPAGRNLLDPTQQAAGSTSALNARVDSEVEILRSQAIALAAVQEGNLITDPEFGPRLSTRKRLIQAVGFDVGLTDDGAWLLKDVVNRFIKARDVKRRGVTYIISVGMTSENPDRAARLANTFAETYISEQLRTKIEGTLAASDVLNNQIATSQTRLARSEGRLDNYIFDNLDRLEEESGATEISALRTELTNIEANRSAQRFWVERAEAALTDQDWASLTETLADEALAELNREREALARRLGAATEDTPLALDLREALANIEADIETRAKAGLSDLRSEVRGIDDQIEGFREDIRTTLLSSDLSSATLAELFTLRQEAELSRQQVQTLLSRLSELETQALVQVADSRIVSRALPPNDASFPNIEVIVALAFVVSTGLALGLAFTKEFYVGGITSASQLSNLVQIPVGSSVPKQAAEKGMLSVADLVVEKPLSGYAESFRHLRASLDHALRKTQPMVSYADKSKKTATPKSQVILVTSSVPAEGKSTSALAIARTYAMSGKHTILIDADLRKPSLAKQLGVTPNGSLPDYLASKDPENEELLFYVADPKADLLVLPGTGRSDTPTDQLLMSENFKSLVEAARENADVVIIDSPPICPVVDARYIVHYADAVLVVVRFALTAQSLVRHTVSQIKEAARQDTVIIGVLAHQESSTGSYDYQGKYTYYVE